jgi:hypothetical protein
LNDGGSAGVGEYHREWLNWAVFNIICRRAAFAPAEGHLQMEMQLVLHRHRVGYFTVIVAEDQVFAVNESPGAVVDIPFESLMK